MKRENILNNKKTKKPAWRVYIHGDGKNGLKDMEELYERHGDDLYRYLVFRLGSADDAEDVLQEVFCRFARYPLRLRLAGNKRAFVFRVARNEANRFLRSKIVRRTEEARLAATGVDHAGWLASAVVTPEEPGLVLLLKEAEALPAEQKEVIFLKVFEGLTFKEIGLACGLPANTAASRYRYGMEKLRAALEAEAKR